MGLILSVFLYETMLLDEKCLAWRRDVAGMNWASHDRAEQIFNKKPLSKIILSVVRNPYDKLYSLYEYMSKKKIKIKKFKKAFSRGCGTISFKRFIMGYEENHKHINPK